MTYCVDVNILIDAFHPLSPRHAPVRGWLTDALAQPRSIAIPSQVATGFLRIVTNRRLFDPPEDPRSAIGFIDWLLEQPSAFIPATGTREVAMMCAMVDKYGLRAADVSDAALAACSAVLGATFVTGDRGFARFSELTVFDPANSGT